VSEPPENRPGRWSRLGVAAQIATVIGVPIGIIGVVLAAMTLSSKDSAPDGGQLTPVASTSMDGQNSPRPSPSPSPSPAPTEGQASVWLREQGRLCRRLAREAEANAPAALGDLTEQLPTLRAASTIVGDFITDSAALDSPESVRGQVQTMLGHWSDAAVYMTGMIRSAEQGDASTFNERLEGFNSSMETGMRAARELGVTQCT
jgi:hypothetical protein